MSSLHASEANNRATDEPVCPFTGGTCRLGYRKHAVGSRTLYYRVAPGDVIDAVRILHQRMDVDRHFD